jgi:hypothetical protein
MCTVYVTYTSSLILSHSCLCVRLSSRWQPILQGRPVFCVLCAPGSPWNSRRRSCIERTQVASASPWSSYHTAWHCCCRSRPLRPPSLASGVSRHPSQASSRVGQRSCRRGSDGVATGRRGERVCLSAPFHPIFNFLGTNYFRGGRRARTMSEYAPTLTK